MAFVSGTAGSVAYVSGGTTVVQSAYEWSLDIGRDTPDVTAFGDSMKVFVQGIGEWSGSYSVRADPAATSQDFQRNLILGGSVAIVHRFYAGTNYYSGSAFVTGLSPEISYDGTWETSYDFQGSGPLSYT